MFQKLAVAAIAMSVAAVPAAAVTYDAFTSFTGVQGAGNFYYGTYDATTQILDLFHTSNNNCFITGSLCLQSAANHDVPGATASSATSFQYGTVNVPDDRLLPHPGPNNDSVFLAFLAPTAGFYKFSAVFNTQDTGPTGVGLSRFFYDNNVQNSNPVVTSIGALAAGQANNVTLSNSGGIYLGANQAVGFIIDKAGFYGADSTGVNLSVAVPEPATWGMFIGGFGLIGASMRRRAKGVAARA